MTEITAYHRMQFDCMETANHEAGHAVAARILGVSIKEVSIKSDGTGRVIPAEVTLDEADDIFKHVVIAAAGTCAEIMFGSSGDTGWWDGDFRNARRCARAVAKRRRCTTLEVLWNAQLEALKLVRENIWKISSVQIALLQRGKPNEAELAKLDAVIAEARCR